MILAACNNNFEILKLLYSYNHRLEEKLCWWESTHFTLEAVAKQKMLIKAHASPAYISLICEEENRDPMNTCIELIKSIRKHEVVEPEHVEFYKSLERQIEDYMCGLLDQIQSSKELAYLFQYKFETICDQPIKNKNEKLSLFELFSRVPSRPDVCSSLNLLDKAIEHKLVKFVTHPYAQSALTYVRYRHLLFLKKKSPKSTLLKVLIGLLFPVWSLLYLINPSNRLGGFITLPLVSFLCYLMSNLVFIALLVWKVMSNSETRAYLGASPTALEWIIAVWIVAKIANEIQACARRGFRQCYKDIWNWIDIIQLLLFTIAIILRVTDYIQHKGDDDRIYHSNFSRHDLRQISTEFVACAYVFVFLLVLGLVRNSRRLGPLQISLLKMFKNVAQFYCIFMLVMFAFALSLTELYWQNTAPPEGESLCKAGNGIECRPTSHMFSNITSTLETLFWALFDPIPLEKLPTSANHSGFQNLGKVLIGAYYLVASIMLLNMLIAMMTKSFEATTENEETEWEFHRTVLWIRFCRLEFSRPPPMNLIPNPRWVCGKIKISYQWIKALLQWWCFEKAQGNETVSKIDGTKMEAERCFDRPERPEDMIITVKIPTKPEQVKQRSIKVIGKLVQRYKFSNLLKQKNEKDHQMNTECLHCMLESSQKGAFM